MARARVQPAPSLVALISDSPDDHTSDEILGQALDLNQENFLPQRSTAQKPKTTTTNGRVRQAVTKKPQPLKARPTAARKVTKKATIETLDNNDDADEVDELNDIDMVDTIESSKPRKGQQPRETKVSETDRHAVDQISDETLEYGSSPEQTPRKLPRSNNATTHIQPKPFHQIHSDNVDAVDPFLDLMVAPQRAPVLSSRQRRAGSTSSNEGRNPDPALRRKLGEITKKFDAVEVRYRKLHDVGLTEAKTNFDKLKASSEEKARVSTDLINSLKKELAAQKAVVEQAEAHINETDTHRAALADVQAQIASARKEIAELKAERLVLKASQVEVENELAEAKAQIKAHAGITKQLNESKVHAAALSKQLAEAQTERSNLQAKLVAARSASIERQPPGSALKGQKVPVMKVMTTTAEASAAVQEAQSKVDLYSDLTGLLISRVERRPEEQIDMFDCIQTGRNGTLHFKLSLSTDPAESFEDVEFSYLPQFDNARDQSLMELLPYYLLEDIQFSRQEAAKFYSRVFEMLTRKHEEAEADEEVEG